MKRMFKLAVLAGAVLSMASCDKNDDQQVAGIFKGPESAFHDGKAFSWVQISNQGKPEKLGITIDKAAWESLPVGGDGSHDHANSVTLKLHEKALATTVFKHIGLDWNPAGHEPANVYTLPHFDFHYYLMNEPDRLAIPPYEVNPAGFDAKPAAEFFPVNYFDPGGGVPQMGKHWLDATSPELGGATFTQTFIYGSYNGKVNFMEPMVTRQFIESQPAYERAIPQPAKFQESGYYPTKMRIRHTAHATEVTLEDFIYRQKAN
ncbi:DUF5602 domain-containing protein [Flavihumibacter stibioxidans]|uniref:TTHB210-like domain-containing protein n=1 Tax=Flavihumibacter stibioxidans TaxID=1834163 RepID=A0ABR7M3W3_9BACT|nr:DUF5602 domain-containing protein [Flavihumibacter stibioxidans]MBC6489695.1 hypothetical protein [Flavihumibacter stibioxidans]